MTIRNYENKDREQVEKLAEKYGFPFPEDGKIIVAESEGEIKAFTSIRFVPFIEPFIAESSFAGKQLFDFMEERLIEGKVPIVRCFTKKENVKLFEKLGFYKVYESEIPLEKNYYREVYNGR